MTLQQAAYHHSFVMLSCDVLSAVLCESFDLMDIDNAKTNISRTVNLIRL